MKHLTAAGVLSLLLLWVVAGCNIFSFSNPADSDADYVAEGVQHLQDGEHADAEESFTKALEENPNNADARWGRAKARLRGAGYPAIVLVSELSQIGDLSANTSLPFQDLNVWPNEEINPVYQALYGVREDIGAIYSGGANNDEFQPDDVALDYVGVLAVHGIMMLRDTNVDGAIDDNDFNLSALLDAINGLELDPNMWDNLPDSVQNALIEQAVNLFETSTEVLIDFAAGLLEDQEIEGFDAGQLGALTDSITAGLTDPEYYNGDWPPEGWGEEEGP
ncbi:MAG: hypothetical protein P9L92_12685 [Candidatus Electryonea clarkiae]|nr:hypothetical protein [Candidatus Electryonea clarkiae]MDP8285030.1 hypothetical protein [Candidatus Electryonea clarkiae]